MSHIEQDYDGAVQFVCDCGAHFVLKMYDIKQCPKCIKEWFYDYDIKEVYNASPTDKDEGTYFQDKIYTN